MAGGRHPNCTRDVKVKNKKLCFASPDDDREDDKLLVAVGGKFVAETSPFA